MKRKIYKLFVKVLCIFGVFNIINLGYDFYNKYTIKQNLYVQTSQYNNRLATFGGWNVTRKQAPSVQKEGMLMSTSSLSSTKNNITSQFFASIHTLSVDNRHYTDLFLSVYYPHEFGLFDLPPVLYYSVDNEIPITPKVSFWEVKDNVLYFHFRPNVYDFIKKCSIAKTITFTIIDYKRQQTITETFSLNGFTNAYIFSINQLNKMIEDFSKNLDN